MKAKSFWEGSERKKLIVAILGIVVLNFLTFHQAVKGDFVNLDDYAEVLQNPYVTKLSWENFKHIWAHTVTRFWVPLNTLSLALDYWLWRGQAFGFHLTNLLLHSLTSIFIFLIGIYIFRHKAVAFVGTMFFALHPAQVESVAWITERKGLLCGLFLFIAVYLYLRWERRQPSEGKRGHLLYCGSVLAFGLSLLAKQTSVVFPLLILLYEMIGKGGKKRIRRALERSAPFFLVVATYIMLILLWTESRQFLSGQEAQYYTVKATLRRFALLTCPTAANYVGLAFFPNKLYVFRHFVPPGSLWEWLKAVGPAVILISIGCFWTYKKWKMAFLGIIWFLANLLPYLNILPLARVRPVSERYLYFPLFGFGFLLAAILAKATLPEVLREKRSWLSFALLSLVILVFYSAGSFAQVHAWQNSETLWKDTLRENPNSLDARYALGLWYIGQGRLNEAEKQFRSILEKRAASMEGHYGLGYVYLQRGLLNEAEEEFQEALSPEATSPAWRGHLLRLKNDIRAALAEVWVRMGKLPQAEDLVQEIIRQEPKDIRGSFILGYIRMSQRRYEEAIALLEKYRENHSKDYRVNYWLGLSLAELSQFGPAKMYLKEAIAIDPSSAEAHLALAKIYANQGYWVTAKEECKKALSLKPENSEAKFLLKAIEKEGR